MTRQEFIAALRRAAYLFEQHPDLPMPACGLDINLHFGGDDARERFAAAARVLGHTKKVYVHDTLWLEHYIAGTYAGDCLRVQLYIDREKVCRKIVTTKTLPPTPEQVIPAQPERVVEEVEWECEEPILAGASMQAVGAEA